MRGRRRGSSEERVYLRPDADPIELPRNSAVRHLFERVRDEAHRFAITYHRKRRGRITSELDDVPGVGATRKRALLAHFGSAKAVSHADLADLKAVDGISDTLAETIYDYFHEKG